MNGFADEQPDFFNFTTLHGGRDWTGWCATGHLQSPIDIDEHSSDPARFQVVTEANSTFGPLRTRTQPIPMSQLDAESLPGFNVWLVYNTELEETALGLSHTLGDIRVLTPSEHTLNGVRYPLSLMLLYVLRQPDTNYFPSLLLQLLFQEGHSSPLIDALISNEGEIDLSELFPSNGIVDDYFTYTGSSNVPVAMCREPYTWVIPNYILEASTEQISYWRTQYHSDTGNARDLQPLGNRTIFHFVPEAARSFLQG